MTVDYLALLRNRLDLKTVPFTERGSRILLFCEGSRFKVRLAERWSAWENQWGHYRLRTPFIQALSLLDGDGRPLDVRLTTYPHLVAAHTAIGDFRWMFVDEETLCLALPAGRCGVQFTSSTAPGRADARGGEFKGDSAHRSTQRNLAYTTGAQILRNEQDSQGAMSQRVTLHIEAQAGDCLLLNITPRLGFVRALQPADIYLQRAAGRWQAWFAAAPAVDAAYVPHYYYAWWCMGAGLLSPRFFLTRETMAPSKTWYVGMWQWDAFFHALAYRHVDRRLAEDHLRIVTDHQRADGMLPDAVHDEGIIYEFPLPDGGPLQEVTKPPLIAWTALKLYELSGNLDFLQEMYEPIVRWTEWWFAHNDDDHDGIVQFNHPNCSSDDSPLWDEGMPVESPDINTYLVTQMDALARIAELIGEAQDAPLWRQRAADLTQAMIDQLWDEQSGVFVALKDHHPVRAVTLLNLFPLITGRLPRRIADRIVQHLQAPDEFWTPWPLPTVARSDPKFDPEQMWRGPLWANINYLFIEGLARCGYADLARDLRGRTLAVIEQFPDFYEYYNPLTGGHPPKAAGMFGWTSAVYIDLAIQASRERLVVSG